MGGTMRKLWIEEEERQTHEQTITVVRKLLYPQIFSPTFSYLWSL